MNKVKAYTLVEVSVVILLTGLLISSIFSILFITNKTYFSFDKKGKRIDEWVLLDLHLTKDIYLCDSMFYKGKNIQLYRTDTLIEYVFKDSTVVRKKDNAILSYDVLMQSVVFESLLPQYPESPAKKIDITFLVNTSVYRCRYVKKYGSIVYLTYGNKY